MSEKKKKSVNNHMLGCELVDPKLVSTSTIFFLFMFFRLDEPCNPVSSTLVTARECSRRKYPKQILWVEIETLKFLFNLILVFATTTTATSINTASV